MRTLTDCCAEPEIQAMQSALSTDCVYNVVAGAAREAGYSLFLPDACLINRYEPGARLSLHQDKNERDFDQPIVSVSLGLSAIFIIGPRTPLHNAGARQTS
jgi:alkylated DNA repair protein (DNA oxidative demethylase)